MQDTESGPKIKELMPVLSDLYDGPPYGFPDATKRILDTLQTPEGLKTITDEVRVFYSAYAADPELMRWKRYAPVRQLWTLEELAQLRESLRLTLIFSRSRSVLSRRMK